MSEGNTGKTRAQMLQEMAERRRERSGDPHAQTAAPTSPEERYDPMSPEEARRYREGLVGTYVNSHSGGGRGGL